MGPMQVPPDALYGASTARAVLNFPISGYRFTRPLLRALGLIKWAAAQTNAELGRVSPDAAQLIAAAAREVADGKLDEHFVIDVFQTGSGTSTNMNVNEVIANRCAQMAGKAIGSRDPVHPNDHVNQGQSSNDVIPTAIHVAVASALRHDLAPALATAQTTFSSKAQEFENVIKIGRTHLMDATPVSLGQEFSGYARQLELSVTRANRAVDALMELPLGGTAVGTGLNTHPEFARRTIAKIARETGLPFVEASNHFEAQGAKDALCEVSGQLKTIAISLYKIANDLRLLNSGPQCGLGEIRLPATQPGSSIMPGKVNPVLSESLMQVAAFVIGADTSVTWCAANGNLELNVMMPLMAHQLLESIRILSNAVRIFEERCVRDLTANETRCEELVERSLAMVTSLAPVIGYDKAAAIAKRSAETGKTVREICIEENVLPREQLEKLLDPRNMLAPH
jgi:fumarate hydratase class II